jgi:hypothetical protein
MPVSSNKLLPDRAVAKLVKGKCRRFIHFIISKQQHFNGKKESACLPGTSCLKPHHDCLQFHYKIRKGIFEKEIWLPYLPTLPSKYIIAVFACYTRVPYQ